MHIGTHRKSFSQFEIIKILFATFRSANYGVHSFAKTCVGLNKAMVVHSSNNKFSKWAGNHAKKNLTSAMHYVANFSKAINGTHDNIYPDLILTRISFATFERSRLPLFSAYESNRLFWPPTE